MHCLTINAGSSSIKYQLFIQSEKKLEPLFGGLIENIGEGDGLWHHQGLQNTREQHRFVNHVDAFAALSIRIQQSLDGQAPERVGHRVVHGGQAYIQPTLITDEVLAGILSLSRLAPLHNPANASGIRCAREAFPRAKHYAIFDTAFHAHMPGIAALYPLDRHLAAKEDIRRYGFHGINHQWVAQQAADWLEKPLQQCQFISLHLGNGASSCLIKEGYSQDTSMGMTPLAGLMMGTRCGDIDPAIPLYLLQQGYSSEAVNNSLNRQSGLQGMADDNDMRHLLARAEQEDAEAILAIDMYCYVLQKSIGAYFSQCDRLDALIFTGGVGENAAIIREKTLAKLGHFGLKLDKERNRQVEKKPVVSIGQKKPAILLVQGDEERAIATMVCSI